MIADSAAYIALNPTLGTPEFHNGQFKVFPNPASSGSQLNVVLPNDVDQFIVELRDMTGRIVLTSQQQNSITLEEGTFPSGMYLWTVTAEGQQSATGKLIIQ